MGAGELSRLLHNRVYGKRRCLNLAGLSMFHVTDETVLVIQF